MSDTVRFWGLAGLAAGRSIPALPSGPRPGIIVSVEDQNDYEQVLAAAQAGDPEAMNRLGILLGRRGQRDEATGWLQRAAEAGNLKAMHNVGRVLFTNGDLDTAEVWLRKAVDQGNSDALTTLGSVLVRKGDKAEGESVLRSRAEIGDDRAKYSLGGMLYLRGDTEEALVWIEQAAEHGLTVAMVLLAKISYERGDSQRGDEWRRRAAEAGDVESMRSLANSFNKAGDYGDAEKWHRKAAEGGSVDAMSALGYLLFRRGAISEAEDWWRRAAIGGNGTAMSNLATALVQRGELDDAEHWYTKAVQAGNQGAAEGLEKLRTKREQTDRWLDAVRFDSFGWPLVTNTEDLRQWRSDNATLSEKYFPTAPNIDVWNMDELRSVVREMFHLVETGELRLEDIEMSEQMRAMMQGQDPEVGHLIELEVVESLPARCLSVTTRHGKGGIVHFDARVLVLFADRFWALVLDVEEDPNAVGDREAAVAHVLLETGETAVGESFDPYDRRWDGLLPVEHDALTRLRLLAPRIRESLSFSDDALRLPPLEFPE
jgi:TPR repeat protein